MGLRGTDLLVEIYFEPGFEKTYSYHFATNAGFTQDYQGYVRMHNSNADLTPYVEMSQYYWEDVPTDALMPFSATIKLPDKIDTPGIHDIRVGVRETQTLGGGAIGVRTGSEGRIIVIVLHPYEYAETEFTASNANANSTAKFTFNIHNLGEPDLFVKGRVEVYSDDSLLGFTNTENLFLKSREERALNAYFNTTGLKPGTYRAFATLNWGNNVSTFNKTFQVGSKTVHLIEHDAEFRTDAINKMLLTVQSGWNTPFKNVYGLVKVFDEIGNVKTEFRTVGTELNPWNTALIEGYFDTEGYSPGMYDARISLIYDGGTRAYETVFNVSEKARSITVDRIPEEPGVSGWVVLLVVLVAILIITLIGLVIVLMRK